MLTHTLSRPPLSILLPAVLVVLFALTGQARAADGDFEFGGAPGEVTDVDGSECGPYKLKR